MTEEETKTVEKKYRCPACGYTGTGLVVEVTPPRNGMTNPSGVYCPYCEAMDKFRTIAMMQEVKQ